MDISQGVALFIKFWHSLKEWVPKQLTKFLRRKQDQSWRETADPDHRHSSSNSITEMSGKAEVR